MKSHTENAGLSIFHERMLNFHTFNLIASMYFRIEFAPFKDQMRMRILLTKI